jgi:hypothetical protein
MSAITIDLAPETEKRLREKAGSAGLTLEVYLRRLAEHDANRAAERPVTFDQILAPFREGFAASGLTEDELASEFEAARDEVWQGKRARKPSP